MNVSTSMNLQKIIDIVGCNDYKTKWAGRIEMMTEHYRKILIGRAIYLFERMSKMGSIDNDLCNECTAKLYDFLEGKGENINADD